MKNWIKIQIEQELDDEYSYILEFSSSKQSIIGELPPDLINYDLEILSFIINQNKNMFCPLIPLFPSQYEVILNINNQSQCITIQQIKELIKE